MSKSELKKRMIFSNVKENKMKKKADKESALENKESINLDNEIIIGLARIPEPEEKNIKKVKKGSNKSSSKNNKENINGKVKNKKKNKENEIDKNKVDYRNINKKEKENINEEIEIEIKRDIIMPTKQNLNNVKKHKSSSKKKKIIKKITMLSTLTVLLAGGIIYFMLSPVFNIKTISVIGNNNLTSQQIIYLSEIKLNENIFKMSQKKIIKNILSNPYIENVKINMNYMQGIVNIEVKERETTFMLEYGNSYVYINNQGYILEISNKQLNVPILKGYTTSLEDIKPGNRLGLEDLQRLKSVLSIIKAANNSGLLDIITKIDIEDESNYKLIISPEDKTVHLGDSTDLYTKMLYIKDMITREKNIEGEFFVNRDLNKYYPVFREKV